MPSNNITVFLHEAGKLFLIILLSAAAIVLIDRYLETKPDYHRLNAYSGESEEFRAMNFSEGGIALCRDFAKEHESDLYEVIAVSMLNYEYQLEEAVETGLSLYEFNMAKTDLEKKKPIEFKKLCHAYETILADLKYFPLPAGNSEHSRFWYYGNSWGAERTYGGERRHEGTDIMDGENERGFFPVISMSDGVLENIGWLEQGGYRIGIRTPHGAYLYYAHLASYAQEFTVGENITAGQLLGYMGDTGYSKVEGTTGNFAVHLHLGIYYQTDNFSELSVNPYFILKFLESKMLKYSY